MNIRTTRLRPATKSILSEWLFVVVAITAMMYFYYIVTWWSLSDYLRPGVIGGYVQSGYAVLEIGLQGMIIGILFGLTGVIFERTTLRRKPLGTIILIKSVCYFFAALISQVLVSGMYHFLKITRIDVMKEIRSEVSTEMMIGMGLYFVVVLLLINLILQINRKFGKGVLISIVLGKSELHPTLFCLSAAPGKPE